MTGSVQADARRGGARILVIEDEPGIVQALRTNLSAHGFQVVRSRARKSPDFVLASGIEHTGAGRQDLFGFPRQLDRCQRRRDGRSGSIERSGDRIERIVTTQPGHDREHADAHEGEQ